MPSLERLLRFQRFEMTGELIAPLLERLGLLPRFSRIAERFIQDRQLRKKGG